MALEQHRLVFKKSEIVTWPNLFTLMRALAIPVFLWLLFSRHNRAAAAWLVGGLGATDWVDGWLARRFNQATDFGAMFDPVVDRLLFIVVIPALVIDDSVPVWVAGALLCREVVVGAVTLLATATTRSRPNVTWEGKTGTFLMMFGLPMFLGANSTLSYAPILAWLAWFFSVPGLAYSWYSALFQYLPSAVRNSASG